ncbi:hypothetical protein HYH02_003523 [Chlamydomonas schloesseri]|uniref:Alpha 1,4-glycosyltransferase domain-containing protein n=1 Tax=Chlamydomonas schloesseri TaxID=2026947 RepID=A0A835WQZ6_9CHLO|nr:hypothetical protein HYH02_003523 [Chlamydomonas schloesseri]|eukprot:KAG2451743.1 hypothetical protein HYH02_003523 [Chlamydomonas schloesseri]
MKTRSTRASAAFLASLTAATILALVGRCSAVVNYNEYRTHLDQGGPDFNIFLIWTTKASTLDELAIQALSSVVEVYKPLRQELLKEAAERAAAASRVGSAKRNKTPEATEQAAAFAAEHAVAPGGLHLFANRLDDGDLAARGWGGRGGTGLTLVHYDVHDVLEDTPLGSWFKAKEEKLRTGKFYFSHITDMMRFALVYKHGGLYLDADVIMMRPISLSHLNAVVRPPHTMIECAVVYFEAGHPFIWEVLTYIKNNYAINDWTTAGPRALTVVYDNYNFHGPSRDVYDLPLRLAPGTYYGLRLDKAKAFWDAGELVPQDFAGCEAVHVWGSIARGYLSHSGRKDYYLDEAHRQRVQQRVAALRAVPGCRPDAPRVAPGESVADLVLDPQEAEGEKQRLAAVGRAGHGQQQHQKRHGAAGGAGGGRGGGGDDGGEGEGGGAGAPPPEEEGPAPVGTWDAVWSAAFGDTLRNPQHVAPAVASGAAAAAVGAKEEEEEEEEGPGEEGRGRGVGEGSAGLQGPGAGAGGGDTVAADVMRGLRGQRKRGLAASGRPTAAAAAAAAGAGSGGGSEGTGPVLPNYKEIKQPLDDGSIGNIFLTWTTGPETLDALAVECISSVINAYGKQLERPGARGGVYLLANQLSEEKMEELGWKRRGVYLTRYSVEDVLADTPVGSWYVERRAELEAGKYWFSHVTDLMRFALVYKHGGIYMDTDVLVMRPISPSHVNKLVRALSDSNWFECAVMFFQAGHPYLFEVLKQIPRHYRAVDWISAGPKALTIVYDHAPMHALQQLPGLVDAGVYLGIRLTKAKRFWKEGHIRTKDFVGCEVVHLWGSTARGYVTKKSTTYITGQEQEEQLKQRLAMLQQISWCKRDAPRLDHCGNATECAAVVKALAAAPKPPPPGVPEEEGGGSERLANGDSAEEGTQEQHAEQQEGYLDEGYPAEEEGDDEQGEQEEVEEESEEGGLEAGHRGGSLELEEGQEGGEEGGSELRRGVWSSTAELGDTGGRRRARH